MTPEEHHRLAETNFGPQRYFEDFAIGETFYIPSRTMTDGLFAAFQLASGDNHPIHYDRNFCKSHGHRDLFAHGYQVLIQSARGCSRFSCRTACVRSSSNRRASLRPSTSATRSIRC